MPAVRIVAILALVLAVAPLVAGAAAKSEKRSEAYALVRGTVFRDTGLALAGAEVILVPAAAEAGKHGKQKRLAMASDIRGEFAFRVAAGQANYVLTVRAKGYQEQNKPIATTGEDRIDVFFRLDPTSK